MKPTVRTTPAMAAVPKESSDRVGAASRRLFSPACLIELSLGVGSADAAGPSQLSCQDFVDQVSAAAVRYGDATGRAQSYELLSIDNERASTRPQHGFSSMMFDMELNAPAAMGTLFKTGTLVKLNAALAKVIERERPHCAGRQFDWSQVTLRPPDQLFIEFPYNPSQWQACGDGVEVLAGTVVSDQILRPAALRPRQIARR